MTTTIYNTDTQQTVELSIIDPKTGCDWAADLVGNAGGGNLIAGAPDGVDVYANWHGDSEEIGWWTNYAACLEAAYDRLHAARQEATDEQRAELYSQVAGISCDIGDEPPLINKIIDDVMGEDFEA